LEVYFIFLPFYGIFILQGNTLQSIALLALFPFLILGQTTRLRRLDFALLAFLIPTGISFLVPSTDGIALAKFVLTLLILISVRRKARKDFSSIVSGFVVGAVFATVYGLVVGRYDEAWFGLSMGGRFIGSVGDPNYLSRLNLIAIASVLGYGRNWPLRVKTGMIGILALGILMSGSKMGFFLLPLVLASNIIPAFLKARLGMKRIAAFTSLTLLLLVFVDVRSYLPALERLSMSEANVSGLSTGRTELQFHAIRKWAQSDDWLTLLVGFGYRTSQELTADLNSATEANVLHSIPLEGLVEFGLVGFVALLILYAVLVANVTKHNRYLLLVFVPTSLFLSGLLYYDLIYFFTVFDADDSSADNATVDYII
jgi:hypothetical protein